MTKYDPQSLVLYRTNGGGIIIMDGGWVVGSVGLRPLLVPTDLFGRRRSRNGKQCRLEEVISARFTVYFS